MKHFFKNISGIFVLFLLSITITHAQKTWNFSIEINDLPESKLMLAQVYGDKSPIVDTLYTDSEGRAQFVFSSANSPGMYRLYFDRDNFADFIFNREDISLKTDYYHPMDSMKVIRSLENSVYYDFLRKDQQYQLKLELLTPVTSFYPKDNDFYGKVSSKFEDLQNERDELLLRIAKKNPDAFVSKLILFQRSPIIPAGLSDEGKTRFMQIHYFDKISFDDADLLYSDVLPTKVINYLSLYSNRNFTQKQLEEAFIKGIDQLMTIPFNNQLVKEFVLEYLVKGFENYGFESVILHIADTYQDESTCENEEKKSDLQIRLENFKKLAIGKTAPDLIVPSNESKQIQLSKIDADYVMLIFWATWCPHCTQWIPQIRDLYNNKKSNMEILAISLDEKENEWKNYIRENNLKWLNASELKGWKSQAAETYNIYATPTIIVVDRNLKIVSKPLSMQQIQYELNERK